MFLIIITMCLYYENVCYIKYSKTLLDLVRLCKNQVLAIKNTYVLRAKTNSAYFNVENLCHISAFEHVIMSQALRVTTCVSLLLAGDVTFHCRNDVGCRCYVKV